MKKTWARKEAYRVVVIMVSAELDVMNAKACKFVNKQFPSDIHSWPPYI